MTPTSRRAPFFLATRRRVATGALTVSLVCYASESSVAAHGRDSTCVPSHRPLRQLVHQFDYSSRAPLQRDDLSVSEENGAKIVDLTYVSLGQTVSAYLISPLTHAPVAAAVFVHWLDDSPTANRNEFRNEAIELASHGVASLLIQGVYPWINHPQGIEDDCEATIQQTIAIRRGLDLLLTNPAIDRQRVAFIGHDYGAMYGAILSGVDPRFKALALLTPSNRFSTWNVPFFLDSLTPYERLEYIVATASLDPMTYVGAAGATPVFYQYARHDRFMSLVEINDVLEVAGAGASYQIYDADHSLSDGQSQRDRIQWLLEQLDLP